MKKTSFMLFAALFAVAANAQNMQMWSNNDVIHQQAVSTIDSITFDNTSSDFVNIPNVESLCKTWTALYDCYELCSTISLTLTNSNTFSCTLNQNGGNTYNCSGKYLVQGHLVLLCSTSGTNFFLPTSLVYSDGNLYGSFSLGGHLKLQ